MTKKLLSVAMMCASLLMYSCATIDCSSDTSSYQDGYASGKLVKAMGEYGTCSEFLESAGKKGTDCFCDGYEDGLSGNPSKY